MSADADCIRDIAVGIHEKQTKVGALVDFQSIIHRRIALRDLLEKIKEMKNMGNLTPSDLEVINILKVYCEELMLENATRQAIDSLDDGLIVIKADDIKKHSHPSSSGQDEQREYMDLHLNSYEQEGLLMVTANKPAFHCQPFHAHNLIAEHTAAIHDTSAIYYLRAERQSRIEAKFGQMIVFSPRTVHTLENPLLTRSVDISIKVPDALGDRITFDDNDCMARFIIDNNGDTFKAEARAHQSEYREEGVDALTHCIYDCGKSYQVVLAQIAPRTKCELVGIPLADGTAGVLKVFSKREREDAPAPSLLLENGHATKMGRGDMAVFNDGRKSIVLILVRNVQKFMLLLKLTRMLQM